ncbi:hypothetical protein GJ689_24525 [Rhodoplanes serenus]|uniref:Uncharacterized protein n=1 Tax=Rhodoplanes serenus TaxID=200615 RepID=A0A9X4XUN7_9BRAD|nr:hypothetical protein [Rhodoplanes serenus]MTW19361.1 hypothetical protein [Rhodoplanes serenus]
MTVPRHSWDWPHRDVYATNRACRNCGIIKVTRHEPGLIPWTEFWRDGARVEAVGRTPPCEGEAPQAAGEVAR